MDKSYFLIFLNILEILGQWRRPQSCSFQIDVQGSYGSLIFPVGKMESGGLDFPLGG